MAPGRIIDLKSFNKFFGVLKNNKFYIFFTLIFLVGFILGIFSPDKFKGFSEFADEYLENFILLREQSGFLKIVFKAFSASFTFIILIFISGSSALGITVLPFLTAAEGFIYGLVISGLYSQYGLKGIAFNAVMILPVAVIFVTAIILASREAAEFSLRLLGLTLPNSAPANLFYDFKNYCGRFLVISAVILFSACVDGVISVYFADKFTL